MFLDPFSRAEKSPFLAIPGGDDDRPPRLPPGLEQLGQPSCGFHQGNVPAGGVRGAIHPGIVMVTVNNPLLGIVSPVDARDHVVEGPHLPVERQLEVHFRWSRADMVGQWQCASPRLWHDGAVQVLQDWLRVVVGDGQNRYFQKRLRFSALEPSRARLGGPPWCERIAGMDRHVHHAAPTNNKRA